MKNAENTYILCSKINTFQTFKHRQYVFKIGEVGWVL